MCRTRCVCVCCACVRVALERDVPQEVSSKDHLYQYIVSVYYINILHLYINLGALKLWLYPSC
jgi:hypothetical protein